MNPARMLALCTLVCAGCAHLPEGTVSYRLAKTNVRFSVTQSIACDTGGRVLSVAAVTPAYTFSADLDREPVTLSYAGLRSLFADTDVKVDLYEDGRLKGLNGTLEGKGEDILKTVVSIAAVVAAAVPAQTGYTTQAVKPKKSICDFINDKAGGKYKAISVTYQGDVDPKAKGLQDLTADAVGQAYAADLKEVATACVSVEAIDTPPKPFDVGASSEGILLKARQPAQVVFSVRTGRESAKCADEVWRGQIPVGQLGVEYDLPLLKAPLFGKQVTMLAIAESGAVTQIQYASTTGTAQALHVLNDALTAQQAQAQKQADAINAQVNLIVAQQRLAKCRADPSSCQ